jgi:hypothetical protein
VRAGATGSRWGIADAMGNQWGIAGVTGSLIASLLRLVVGVRRECLGSSSVVRNWRGRRWRVVVMADYVELLALLEKFERTL